jgi:biotin carboxyl carrier protein
MNNILIAPYDAVIKKINVKPGDKVPKDYLLVQLKK